MNTSQILCLINAENSLARIETLADAATKVHPVAWVSLVVALVGGPQGICKCTKYVLDRLQERREGRKIKEKERSEFAAEVKADIMADFRQLHKDGMPCPFDHSAQQAIFSSAKISHDFRGTEQDMAPAESSARSSHRRNDSRERQRTAGRDIESGLAGQLERASLNSYSRSGSRDRDQSKRGRPEAPSNRERDNSDRDRGYRNDSRDSSRRRDGSSKRSDGDQRHARY